MCTKVKLVINNRHIPIKVVAVVLGAGQGTRMGQPINKVFLPINGKPVIIYAVETFERCSAIDEILLVAATGEAEPLLKLARSANCHKVKTVVNGGATRHASEKCALEALRPQIDSGEIEVVLIHDGARPFIPVDRVHALVEKARAVGGAILAAPLQEEDIIVQVDEQRGIQKSFEGGSIWKAQTPQAFRASLLLDAYDRAERDQFYGTDTAASLERIGCSVAIVESDVSNLKITTAHDLFHAEKLSHHRRI